MEEGAQKTTKRKKTHDALLYAEDHNPKIGNHRLGAVKSFTFWLLPTEEGGKRACQTSQTPTCSGERLLLPVLLFSTSCASTWATGPSGPIERHRERAACTSFAKYGVSVFFFRLRGKRLLQRQQQEEKGKVKERRREAGEEID